VVAALVAAVVAAASPAVTDPVVAATVWVSLLAVLVLGTAWPVVVVWRLRAGAADHGAAGVDGRGAASGAGPDAHGPAPAVVGARLRVAVRLGRRLSDVSVGWVEEPAAVVVGAGPARSVTVPLTARRRGRFEQLRLAVACDAPFGLLRATRIVPVPLARPLVVRPRPDRTDRPVPPRFADRPGTAPPTGASSSGEAVRTVRPYVAGDPAHLVHWPSTARVGALVVRELEPPAARAVAVVVDLGPGPPTGVPPGAGSAPPPTRPPAPGEVPAERAVARAAAVVTDLLARGTRVVLCTAGPRPDAAEVTGPGDALDRLAAATVGTPGAAPAGWPVHRVSPPSDAGPGTAPGGAAGRSEPTGTVPTGVAVAPGARPPGARRAWPRASGDRRSIGAAGTAAVGVLLAVSFWAALSTLPTGGEARAAFVQVAVLTALLAVVGLRSVPLRWIARSYALLGAVLMGRFGLAGGASGLGGLGTVLVWVLATSAGLALTAPPDPVRRGAPATERAPGGFADRLRATTAVAALVAAAALWFGPAASGLATTAPSDGGVPDPFDQGRENALTAVNELDMTTRPRLSDRVAFTVRSDVVSFWRTATYDEWDGTTWRWSDAGAYRTVPGDGRILSAPDDLAARAGRESTQRFRLEAGAASGLPVAASPTRLEGPGSVVQRPDGSLIASPALGRGAAYSVTSRQVPVVAADLRAAGGTIPAAVRDRYGRPAEATDRTRRLARRITAGAGSDYDRVRAVEAWMDENLSYSIDAPLSPTGVDVVDHFLFESRTGWCEQIASSMVVLLREVGVPARLATGFVPGQWDPVGRRFVVRERDAHAWVEVWFPGIGWVPFDPTAAVPLAGEPGASTDALPLGAGAAGALLLAAAAAVLVAGPATRALQRALAAVRQRRRRRRLVRHRWDVAAEERLEELGRSVGLRRRGAETATAHARMLAERTGDPRLGRVGELVDRARYGPGVTDEDRRFAEQVLASAG
jgi:transglutaminase-like putative cysteine protease